MDEQVVKVHRPSFEQPRLVAEVNLANRGVEIPITVIGELLGRDQAVLGVANPRMDATRWIALAVFAKVVFDDRANEPHLVRRVVD